MRRGSFSPPQGEAGPSLLAYCWNFSGYSFSSRPGDPLEMESARCLYWVWVVLHLCFIVFIGYLRCFPIVSLINKIKLQKSTECRILQSTRCSSFFMKKEFFRARKLSEHCSTYCDHSFISSNSFSVERESFIRKCSWFLLIVIWPVDILVKIESVLSYSWMCHWKFTTIIIKVYFLSLLNRWITGFKVHCTGFIDKESAFMKRMVKGFDYLRRAIALW